MYTFSPPTFLYFPGEIKASYHPILILLSRQLTSTQQMYRYQPFEHGFLLLLCNLMNYAYLLIGGNMEDREHKLSEAARLLEERCGSIIDRSSVYETAAWGKTDQDDFLNQALIIETRLNAKDLLKELQEIENLMGRNRKEKFDPRIIDIDIIFFNHEIINDEELKVPHPEMIRRNFVLEPLNEIAPAYIHPVFYKTVKELLAGSTDLLAVKKLNTVL